MAQRQPAPKDKHLTRTVYEQLLEDILSGRRRPGEPLSELALPRELGVSRTPVHNAMLQLTKNGLINQLRNCRPVLRGLTHKDIHQMFEMRILLQYEAARLAASRMDAAPLGRLHHAPTILCQTTRGGAASTGGGAQHYSLRGRRAPGFPGLRVKVFPKGAYPW